MTKKMNYKVVAKYIKDIKFDIIKPDIFFAISKDITKYKFKIDIKSNSYKNNVIEVETTLSLTPKETIVNKINASVTFSILSELDKNLNKQELEEIILVKIPSESYPELRRIFIFIFESSGFRDINIDKNVDFKKLYLSRKN